MSQYFPVPILSLPNGTMVQATDVYPAVDTTDMTESNIGTTKQYTIAQLLNAVSGLVTINQTTTPVNMLVNTTYVCSAGSTMINYFLPATCPFGSFFRISGKDSGLFRINQNSGQVINFGNVSTLTGTMGTVTSTNANDELWLLCTVANTTFEVVNSVGNLTVVGSSTVVNNCINAPLPLASSQGGTGVASPTQYTLPIANGSSPFNFAALEDGQILIGATGGTPLPATLTEGANITITNTPNGIEIAAAGTGFTFTYEQAFWVAQNNGNNAFSGESINRPFATLQYAIVQAATTPTVIYLTDGFTNAETVTTSGAGQTIYIVASATNFTGTYTVASGDSVYVLAPSVAGFTNNGILSVQAQSISGLTSSGAGSLFYLQTSTLDGLTLASSTGGYLSCNYNMSAITNDSTAYLNGTLGGILPGLTGAQQISGQVTCDAINFTPTTQGIVGTTAADDAASGYVGEFINSNVAYGSAISLSTTTVTNLTSIVLTAGDWDVTGNAFFQGSTAIIAAAVAGISTVSANTPDLSYLYIEHPTAYVQVGGAVPPQRINVNTTTTVYIVVQANFASGTVTACGNIQARRVR